MKIRIVKAGILCAALLIPFVVLAQTVTTPVEITVRDPTGAPVGDASISVVPGGDNTRGKSETDEKGHVRLNLNPGSYAVLVSAAGFRTAVQCFEVKAVGEVSGDSAATRQTPSQQVEVKLQIGAVSSPTVIYPADSLVLSRNSGNKEIAITPAEFGALPHVTVKVHNGHSDADESYAGVLLTVLLARVDAPGGKNLRGKAMTTYIVAVGSDGYAAVLSLAEVDSEFRTEQVIVADSRDGKPLGKSGPFQLIVPGDKRPARWVHNLNGLRVEQAN